MSLELNLLNSASPSSGRYSLSRDLEVDQKIKIVIITNKKPKSKSSHNLKNKRLTGHSPTVAQLVSQPEEQEAFLPFIRKEKQIEKAKIT